MTVQLTYETGSLVTVNVPVTVESCKKLDLSQLQTVYASIGEANQYTVYSMRYSLPKFKTIVPSYYQQATQLLAEGQRVRTKPKSKWIKLTSNLQSAMKVLVKSRYHAERTEAEMNLQAFIIRRICIYQRLGKPCKKP